MKTSGLIAMGFTMIALVFAIFPVLVAAFALIAWPLWNWIAVGKFGAPHLTYWETWGGLFLLTFLRPINANTKSKE